MTQALQQRRSTPTHGDRVAPVLDGTAIVAAGRIRPDAKGDCRRRPRSAPPTRRRPHAGAAGLTTIAVRFAMANARRCPPQPSAAGRRQLRRRAGRARATGAAMEVGPAAARAPARELPARRRAARLLPRQARRRSSSRSRCSRTGSSSRGRRHERGADFDAWTRRASSARVEAALDALGAGATRPRGLGEAMRYAVLDGGKRRAPAAGARRRRGRAAATRERPCARRCAVELIHAYSLVHDDMPCMDNDVLRRGKPTVHVQFGEAQALLAGDALQALAFEVLTPDERRRRAGACRRGCARCSRARPATPAWPAARRSTWPASACALDEAAAARHAPPQDRRAAAGAACCWARPAASADAARMGRAVATTAPPLGLAFQVVDDILDVDAASATLGKTAGKDAAQQQADLRLGARPRRGRARHARRAARRGAWRRSARSGLRRRRAALRAARRPWSCDRDN